MLQQCFCGVSAVYQVQKSMCNTTQCVQGPPTNIVLLGGPPLTVIIVHWEDAATLRATVRIPDYPQVPPFQVDLADTPWCLWYDEPALPEPEPGLPHIAHAPMPCARRSDSSGTVSLSLLDGAEVKQQPAEQPAALHAALHVALHAIRDRHRGVGLARAASRADDPCGFAAQLAPADAAPLLLMPDAAGAAAGAGSGAGSGEGAADAAGAGYAADDGTGFRNMFGTDNYDVIDALCQSTFVEGSPYMRSLEDNKAASQLFPYVRRSDAQ